LKALVEDVDNQPANPAGFLFGTAKKKIKSWKKNLTRPGRVKVFSAVFFIFMAVTHLVTLEFYRLTFPGRTL
jgi:hypothetical protein